MKLALIAILAGALLHAGADEAISRTRFPDADAVTVNEIEKVKYAPDGTYEQTDECWTKILTEKGRREESAISLDYSKRYGSAAILYVGAIGTNGTERAIDVSATLGEQTDNSSMGSNIYDPLDRRIVCTVPGLRIGETLHVKTRRLATKPRCRDQWADMSVMEWSHPIVSATYEVTAPASRPLRKIAIRHPLGNIATNVTRLADGSLVHTFTVTNSAQAFPEPSMPPLYTQVQNIRVSTAASWQEISKWYWELCVPHIARTNSAMAAKVAETVGSLSGEMERIRALFRFVSQEVRYMGLTEEDTSPGYAPHDVDRTFDSRAGVCRDKASLLVAMLRLAGFKAFPVLIHVGAKLDPEVPQPFFNHAIVAVELHPSSPIPHPSSPYILMDPTNENTKDLYPAYLCNNSYLVTRPEGDVLRTSPVPSPDDNLLTVDSSGKLQDDGSVFLETAIRFGGINDVLYRGAFARRKPTDRQKFFEKVVTAVAPGAEVIRCDIEPKEIRDTECPLAVKLAVKMPEMLLSGETCDTLNVPFVSKTLGLVNYLLMNNTALERRRFPLVLDTTAAVRETVKIDLARTLGRPLALPAADAGTKAGFRHAISHAVTNGVLSSVRTMTVDAVEFPSEEYAALREGLKRAETAERKRPVFERDSLRNADVCRLFEDTETTVLSDRAWVTTNTVVRKILTYAGKKGSAELKFGFNPAVDSVSLAYATVSNAGGRVSAVSAKELNVMDCDWAAAAPRYPAGKLLVATLPAVEIGSVISYRVVRTVTNAPAPFYASYAFDSQEPIVRKIVRVNDWRREVANPRRVPNEANQAPASFWRDWTVVSSNDFAKAARRLCAAAEVQPVDPQTTPLAGLFSSDDPPLRKAKCCRDWMSRHVKVSGPALYDLPIEAQLTDPNRVLRERYATRLDYVRTLCALLRGAGCDADVVFAAADSSEPEAVRRRLMYDKPNERAFGSALCRIRIAEGGFLGFGGEQKTYYLGTESHYAPLGPTAFDGCDCFDPATGAFCLVEAMPDFSDCETEASEYAVRGDGTVDLAVEKTCFGTGVGGFRKLYAEMLPEDRARHYRTLLGGISQAAVAAGELETDVESYPAKLRFKCTIPSYATVQDDLLTIQVPPLVSSLPALVGSSRQTPFAVQAADVEAERVTLRFPSGYTRIESMPKPFVLRNPLDPAEVWLESTVTSKVEGGVLTVTLERKVNRRRSAYFQPSFYELVKDWFRLAAARANRTVVVRNHCHCP